MTKTVDTYFQGMNGDYQVRNGGTSGVADAASSAASPVTDADQFAGMDFEHVVYDGAGGAWSSDTVTIPWTSARRPRPSPSRRRCPR